MKTLLKTLLSTTFLILVIFFIFILSPLKFPNNTKTWIFYDRHGKIIFSEKKYFAENKTVPEQFKKFITAIEDQNFYSHHGIDLKSALRATKQNLQSGEIVSGASTITMQLARLEFLNDQPRNFWYKILQILYATKIDAKLNKDEIINQYLSKVNFGAGSVGLSSATERYFSKTPNNLSIGEMAMLIGVMPNPSRFNPITNPQNAEIRKNLVLEILAERKIITEKDKEFWINEPIILRPTIGQEIHAPHFVFWTKDKIQTIFDQTPEKYQNATEIHVHTTLDKEIYQKALQIMRGEIDKSKEHNNAHNSASVILDVNNNEIIAMIGSVNFFDKEIDGAVNFTISPRSTGSTLKPFLYALALEQGYSPADELRDEQASYPTPEGRYSPRNFNFSEEYGQVRFREALANSYNLSAIYLLQKVGLENFFNKMSELNLNFRNVKDLGLSVILGSGEDSFLTLTNAYSTFAHHGQYYEPQFFTKVTDKNGKILLEQLQQKPKQVFSTSTTDWISNALSDNQIRWKNFSRGNVLEVDRPAAVKTGTSQEFKDNLVVGYSPDFVVGVWVGNSRRAPLHSSSGVAGAGPIWNKIFRYLHQDLPERNFAYSSNRQTTQICRRPYLAENECSEKILEFLTPAEIANMTPTTPPAFTISFPHDGDIFHEDSDILLKVRNSEENDIIHFYLDEKKVNSHLKKLPLGQHEIWAENENGKRTPSVFIEVEGF